MKIDGGSGNVNIKGLHGAVEITGDDVHLTLADNRGPIHRLWTMPLPAGGEPGAVI